MVSITVPLEKSLKKRMEQFQWVNWSEIGRQAAYKKYILEKYMETKELAEEDASFCEQIDWHPVDELPLKASYIKKLKEIEKEKGIKLRKISELFE